ncbi:DUF4097 family beta strand repeat-containing protein [Ornithinimicrobium faecis]|uniref:DUF4097 family beta strand repeat-containing protein n=1 Tax=Ornithinimicrobium faecis TaxID=2934158 RepID=UPI00211932EF|nr:DUF4097 family beta strand repeat-containing protein [Ornithinimicrobium sp. HY1745]
MTSSAKRTFRIVGGILALVIVIGLAIPAVGRILGRTETTTEDLPAGLTSLSLDGDVGDIEVVAGAAGEQPRVVATAAYGFSNPDVTISVSGDTAALSATCLTMWLDNCSVRWEVVVPTETAVAIDNNVGTIEVAGLAGELDVTTDVGGVVAVDFTGERVSVHSDVGDVRIAATGAPQEVTASSDTGDVVVEVPDDGTAYRVSTTTSLGTVRNDLGSDETQSRLIDVRTSVGDIFLRRTD